MQRDWHTKRGRPKQQPMRSSLGFARVMIAVIVIAIVLIVSLQVRPNARQAPLVGGGGAAAAASPTAEPAVTSDPIDLAPTVPVKPPDGVCLRHYTTYDSAPQTVENLASISTRVVAATVQQVGPTRWKNEGETPPTSRQDLTGDSVMRLIRVSIDQDLGSGKATGMVVAWIPGGAIGCHAFVVGGYPVDIQPSQRLTLFLDDRQAPNKTLGGVSRVMAIWPITGASATSAEQGDLTLSDISSIASSALAKTP